MSSVVHAALVLYTTVVNCYSWSHYSIKYDRLSSPLIIPPISEERDESKKEVFTFRNSGLHFATVRIFTTFLLIALFLFLWSEQSRALPMNDALLKRLCKYKWYNWACSHLNNQQYYPFAIHIINVMQIFIFGIKLYTFWILMVAILNVLTLCTIVYTAGHQYTKCFQWQPF